METDSAIALLPALILALIALLAGWFFLVPEICRIYPLQVPGGGFDFCWFVR